MDEILGVKLSCYGSVGEQVWRLQRLAYVVGRVAAFPNYLEHLQSLHDYKGRLTAVATGSGSFLNVIISNAWNELDESEVQIEYVMPKPPLRQECANCDASLFCGRE